MWPGICLLARRGRLLHTVGTEYLLTKFTRTKRSERPWKKQRRKQASLRAWRAVANRGLDFWEHLQGSQPLPALPEPDTGPGSHLALSTPEQGGHHGSQPGQPREGWQPTPGEPHLGAHTRRPHLEAPSQPHLWALSHAPGPYVTRMQPLPVARGLPQEVSQDGGRDGRMMTGDATVESPHPASTPPSRPVASSLLGTPASLPSIVALPWLGRLAFRERGTLEMWVRAAQGVFELRPEQRDRTVPEAGLCCSGSHFPFLRGCWSGGRLTRM